MVPVMPSEVSESRSRNILDIQSFRVDNKQSTWKATGRANFHVAKCIALLTMPS